MQFEPGGESRLGDQNIGAARQASEQVAEVLRLQGRLNARTQRRFEALLLRGIQIAAAEQASGIDGHAADRQPLERGIGLAADGFADAAHLQARG